MKKAPTEKIIFSKIVFLGAFFVFLLIVAKLAYVSLATDIDGTNIKKFAANRNTVKQTLYANRGTIYSSNNEPLAFNVDSYTVIAFLEERRSEGYKTPQHVVNKQLTAEKLSPIINMEVETIYKLLDQKNLYQVELGPGGKGITEMTKEKIEELKLPGIAFISTYKRYYPNHDFLSYILGYSKKYDENLVGELGLELQYNDELKGEDGYLEYQKDLNGFKIPNTREIQKDAKDGNNIYLTINSTIQMFVERIIKESKTTYNPEWMMMAVVEAKTGRILGVGSTPSFDPNIMNIESYLNPLVSYTYEPGSTMKVFTYLAAMEKGTYKGDDTYLSGTFPIGEYVVQDWNGRGWGRLTYDQGFSLSSNVAISNMVEKYITKEDLKAMYTKLGFGKKTGIELPRELEGTVNFKYPIEVANAGFGQGVTITAIQYLQALTAVGNNGIMLKPYLVDKIVDPNTNKIVYQGKKTELGRVASVDSINRVKELMYNVVNGNPYYATGVGYKIDGYDVIGKTGTAEYVDSTRKYAEGYNDYIKSFAGMFPKDNPEIMVYTVVKRATTNTGRAVVEPTKKLMVDVATYLDMFPSTNQNVIEIKEYTMPNLINKDIDTAKTILSEYGNEIIVIGNGTKIINQSASAGTKIDNTEKIFLVTNGKEIKMPNVLGYSSKDIKRLCNLIHLEYLTNGTGYVTTQSIPVDTVIKEEDVLTVDLEVKTITAT